MNNDTIFKASINITTVVEKEILPLAIDIKLGIGFPTDANPFHVAIGLERVRYTLNILFQDAIFGSRTNDLVHLLRTITSTTIAECWDEPWDQFMALLIYYKASAVLEDKAFIEFVNVSTNAADDDLEYTYYGDMLNTELTDIDLDWLKEIRKTKPEIKTLWYHRADTSMNECQSPQEMTWEQLGLVWTRTEKPDNQIEIIKPYTNNIKPFTPKIIK